MSTADPPPAASGPGTPPARRRRPRRWGRWLAVFVVANVLLAHLIGGWIYAGRIAADALAYQPEAPVVPGPPWQRVDYAAPLGATPAWFRPGEGSVWAVLLHGKGASAGQMQPLAEQAAAVGMPCLTIAYRGDVDAPQDPSRQYSFGPREAPDLAAALDYAKAHGASGVVLTGISMGGAIIASALRADAHTGFVKAMVLDSPVTDFGQVVDRRARDVALPGGMPLPPTLSWTAKTMATWRDGVDWAATDYNDDTAWLTVPTLVLQGTADSTVPVTSSRELAARDPDVTLVEIAGAEHVITDGTPAAQWAPQVKAAYAAVAR